MQSVNETVIREELARCIAELAARVSDLSRRLQLIEGDRVNESLAQPTELTIICHDDDGNSIEFHTENGFVIVRPWETNAASPPAAGTFRFRVRDPDGIEREVGVEIANPLLTETARRTHGRIETSSQFWTCCAEQRLANYLMENDQFPPANEMKIESLDCEDSGLAIRWEKAT